MRLGSTLWLAVVSVVLASIGWTDAQTLVKWDDGTGIHIYYRTGWTTPRIHYTQGSSGAWTALPGVKMAPSSDTTQFPKADNWFRFDLAAPATVLEFAFNDNNNQWDNNGGSNYNVQSAGTYSLTSTVSPPRANATPTPATTAPSNTCSNFDGPDYCTSGTQTAFPSSDEARRWQTPPRNATGWSQEFQDYRSLTGYAHVTYNAARTAATVNVRTYLRVAAATVTCSYSYNNAWSSSPTFQVDSSLKDELLIKVVCTQNGASEDWTLGLDPINFVWQANTVKQPPGMKSGQRGAVVDLFGWPYTDIEAECKDFLGKAGYMGVKISPPQEAVLSDRWSQYGERNPWYLVYQPVSYRLYSRMGTRTQLRSMIQTCRANGVRVFADAVVNHMTGAGNDVSAHHRKKESSGSCKQWGAMSSAKGSPYFTHKSQVETNQYTGGRPALEFPAVPFGPTDFHCERSIDDYSDGFQVENGWLVGLSDLNTAKTSVRERIAQYMVDLLGVGFSGFRIDAYRHIGPTDAAAIMGLLNKYMGGSLPDDFVMWGEVLIGGDAKQLACDETSSTNFYKGLDKKYAAAGISAIDIAKLKIWSSDYPKSMPVCGSWILPASRFVIQNDDHDQQSPDSSSRDMGDKGSVLVKAKDVALHRRFETHLFARTDADWKVRVVLSSYTHFANGAAGFPDGLSDCAKGFDSSAGQTCDRSVPYEKAFRAGSCGYTVENFVGGKYTRVHRDLAIVNAMRKWIGLDAVTAAQVGITSAC